jgi:hypothetical protein
VLYTFTIDYNKIQYVQYIQASFSPGFAQQIMPYLLGTTAVMTAAKFEPLIFSVWGLALSNGTNIFISIVLDDMLVACIILLYSHKRTEFGKQVFIKLQKLKLNYDRWSVRHSVLVSPSWAHDHIFVFCLTIAGFLLRGALSDERMGLQFTRITVSGPFRKIMKMKMFVILDRARPDTENIRGLNLAAVMCTTVQVSRLLPWNKLLVPRA